MELAGTTFLTATAQSLALTLPDVQKTRQVASLGYSNSKLNQIALGFHNYFDVNKPFPTTAMLDPDGKTSHSWRVAILPYLDQNSLFWQYRMDEPQQTSTGTNAEDVPLSIGPAGQ